ncbi:MAG: NBR1-Ig-like domain-containing protein [Anaerolineales bacterium]|jgi:hypothetical protein
MKKLVLMIIMAGALVLLVGCNLPSSQSTVDDAQLAQTLAAQTIEARLTENAIGDVNQGDGGDGPPGDTQVPSNTPEPSNTAEPSNTPEPTEEPTEATPCNKAAWVKDVTIPDGTELAPGEAFTKTWRIRNVGSCSWNNDYDLVFDSGDKMGGDTVVNLSIGTVETDETVDISVDLVAPNDPGEYRGDWLLRSDDNQVFGLGNNDIPVFVEIEVVEAVSFRILNAGVYACGLVNFAYFRIENNGTKILQSMEATAQNVDTNAFLLLPGFIDKPFTENQGDCPVMQINDIEPGDIYYVTVDVGLNSGKYEFTLELCTQDGGGGDCTTEEREVTLP